MTWNEVQRAYPGQWVVMEALESRSEDEQWKVGLVSVLEACPDGITAMQRYRHYHQQYPLREFLFLHTSQSKLEFRERRWVGIRGAHAASNH